MKKERKLIENIESDELCTHEYNCYFFSEEDIINTNIENCWSTYANALLNNVKNVNFYNFEIDVIDGFFNINIGNNILFENCKFQLDGGDFKIQNGDKISFKNCEFINLHFEGNYNNILFEDCKINNVLFRDTVFNNIKIINTEMPNNKFDNVEIHNIELKNSDDFYKRTWFSCTNIDNKPVPYIYCDDEMPDKIILTDEEIEMEIATELEVEAKLEVELEAKSKTVVKRC